MTKMTNYLIVLLLSVFSCQKIPFNPIQLLDGAKEHLPCAVTLLEMAEQVMTKSYSKRLTNILVHSKIGYNSMGDSMFCQDLQHNLTTVQLSMPVSLFPGMTLPMFSLVCAPKECNAADLNYFLQEYAILSTQVFATLTNANLKEGAGLAQMITFSDQESDGQPWDSDQQWTLVAFVGIGLLTLIGTLYHYFKHNFAKNHIQSKEDQKKILKPTFLDYFSFRQNTVKLFTVKPDTYDLSSNLNVFSGIRVIMIWYVCYAHSWTEAGTYAENNLNFYTRIAELRIFVFISQGFYAVDAFFFLGGFFAAFVLVSKLKKATYSTFPILYIKVCIHRMLRIIPAYAFCIFFFWKLLPYVGSGPRYFGIKSMSQGCQENWWRNLLFISTIGDEYNTCIGWTWYLSNDFQMFLTAPIIIFALQKSKRIGMALIALLFIGSSIGTGILWYENDYAWFIPGLQGKYGSMNSMKFYFKSYFRYMPYLLGILMGYLYKQGYLTPKKAKSKKDEQLLDEENKALWKIVNSEILSKEDRYPQKSNFISHLLNSRIKRVVLPIIGGAIIFGLAYGERYAQTHNGWPRYVDFLYVVYARTVWCFALFLIILPSLAGRGRLIRFILGNPIMVVLGRLSFCIYLIHYIVIDIYEFNTSYGIWLGNQANVEMSFWIFIVSIFLSYIVSMMVEVPCMQVLKSITQGKPKTKAKEIAPKEVKTLKEKNDLAFEKISVSTNCQTQVNSMVNQNLQSQSEYQKYNFQSVGEDNNLVSPENNEMKLSQSLNQKNI